MTNTPTTLRPLIVQYVRLRHTRGEFESRTARAVTYTLLMLDDNYGSRPLNKFGIAAIDRWMADWSDIGVTTRRLRISHVKGFCQWLVATKRIRTDPTNALPVLRSKRKPPMTLTQREVAAVLAQVEDDRRGLAILWLMVGCGCRRVEVARLNVEDYDRDKLILLLDGKSGDKRKVAVPRNVAAVLNAYLDEAGWMAGPLIRKSATWNRRGAGYGRLSPETIGRLVWEWMTAAGVKHQKWDGRSAHSLRRTCASDTYDAKHDIVAVQNMLGHVYLQTTQAYLRNGDVETMRESMEGRDYSMPAAPALAAVD